MLYELLSGRTPFEPESGSLSELFMLLATAAPVSLDEHRHDLPPGLADVVQRGLAKLPDDRFQSSAEMADALLPYSDRRSELTLRQLLHKASLGPRTFVTSPPAPATVQRAVSPQAVSPRPSERDATQRGWPSEPPPARATAPGVGLADSQARASGAQPRKRPTPLVWVGVGVGCLALGAALALARGFNGPSEAAERPPSGSASEGPAASEGPKSTTPVVAAAGAPDQSARLLALDAGADDGQQLKPSLEAEAPSRTEPARPGEGTEDGRKAPNTPPSKLRLRDIGRDRGSGGR